MPVLAVFRHCETKIFRRKNVIPPIMHKIFRYPKVSETLKGGYPRNFSALWDQNFSIENRDTPPPLLSIKYFSLREFSKTEWFPGEVFSVLWDKKFFDKTVKLPPSFAWKISIPDLFRNTEGFFYEFYWHCETKIFQRSLVISPS